jgi:hypothetical protein
MDAFNSNGNDEQVNLIIKAVDLLMTKSLAKYIHPIQVLGQCKVLTFNNLACIYKKRKKHALALKAVIDKIYERLTLLWRLNNGC